MTFDPDFLRELRPELVELRHALHGAAELSGDEVETSGRVHHFLSARCDAQWQTGVGGHGLLAHFGEDDRGPSLLFRCDLDALPIDEGEELAHASKNLGVSHKCGHDGHMTIACGLGALLGRHPPPVGRVSLLFQPAEETGVGAAAVRADPRWSDAFGAQGRYAFHNLPGRPVGELLIRSGTMNFAPCGLRIQLHGKPSHAAEPELAHSPREALARMLEELPRLAGQTGDRLLTIVHARLGQESFGVTPGDAVLAATLRADSDRGLADLKAAVERSVRDTADRELLDVDFETLEPFPATVNDARAVEVVEEAARRAELTLRPLSHPLRWSEDFGHFTADGPGALVALGSGTDQPALHRPEYDFPDDLIEPGVRLAWHILQVHWEQAGARR